MQLFIFVLVIGLMISGFYNMMLYLDNIDWQTKFNEKHNMYCEASSKVNGAECKQFCAECDLNTAQWKIVELEQKIKKLENEVLCYSR